MMRPFVQQFVSDLHRRATNFDLAADNCIPSMRRTAHRIGPTRFRAFAKHLREVACDVEAAERSFLDTLTKGEQTLVMMEAFDKKPVREVE